jgi:probable HAF family extracellular repeat protein
MRRASILVTAALAGAGMVPAARGAQCPRYEVHAIIENTFCEISPGLTLEDINDDGDVVGEIWCLGGPEKPFVWRNGVMTLLPLPPGTSQGFAKQINSAGQIAGYVATDHWMAIRWEPDGSYVDVLDGQAGFLHALNDRGDVTGFNDDGAFAVIDGVFHDIGALLDDNVSYPYDINDAGHVVGYYDPIGPDGARGFLWEDGHITELHELLDGAPDADARRINGSGIIVGVAFGPTRAVCWIDGKGEFLEVIPGFPISGALDVNDAGRMIGKVSGALVPPGGFGLLWETGVMYRLFQLIAPTDEFAFVMWPRAISSDYIITDVRTAFPEFDDRDVVLRSVPPVPGDTTCDGEVDFSDVLSVRSQWGLVESSTADLDDSGVIDGLDLQTVLANWGR